MNENSADLKGHLQPGRPSEYNWYKALCACVVHQPIGLLPRLQLVFISGLQPSLLRYICAAVLWFHCLYRRLTKPALFMRFSHHVAVLILPSCVQKVPFLSETEPRLLMKKEEEEW